MHATKIWASERTRKVNFIELKVVNDRIYNKLLPPLYFKRLGLAYRLVPPDWHLFHWSSYYSFWDIVPSNRSKNVRGWWWRTLKYLILFIIKLVGHLSVGCWCLIRIIIVLMQTCWYWDCCHIKLDPRYEFNTMMMNDHSGYLGILDYIKS